MEDEEGKEEGTDEKKAPSFTPVKAIMPITMMVVLIVVTLALALWIGPYFDALGITSEMSEYADNPLYAFVFLGFVIAFAVFILVLRKLLKRRRFKLKYIFAFAVLLSSLYILTPVVDIIANGFPEVWEEYDLDIDGIRGALPLDPEDPGKGIIIVADTSFHVLERDEYEYDEIWMIDGLEETFDPHFSNGLWAFAGKDRGENRYWTVDVEGEETSSGTVENENGSMDLIGVSVAYPNGTHYLISFWEGEGNWSLLANKPGSESSWSPIEYLGTNEGPFHPIFGWSNNRFHYVADDSVRYLKLEASEEKLKTTGGGGAGIGNFTWTVSQGENVLLWSPDPYLRVGDESPTKENVIITTFIIEGNSHTHTKEGYHTGPVENGYMVSFTEKNEDHRLLYLSGDEVGVITPDSEDTYSLPEDPIAVFQDGPGGDIYLVFEGAVLIGDFEDQERMQLWIQVSAFLISLGILVLLLKVPKWWIIDISGILMGAGVVALMGTSFPLLFTLLLLILLAIYDAISVYKTKHMISLADAVVESKMPILLVFPMRLDYRYEDETNLMDPKRKRESLFMGLGDVIIPGILVVSSFAWLPRAEGLFGISGPLTVALFSLAGMLLGYAVLIGWVLKGKAHAGLPPLNGGAILGFLLGHLLVYGTFVFW